MSAPRITVVGSVNLDLIVRCPHLPAPGETVLGGDFLTAPGGKGANQALAAKRLGADTALIGRIGRDDHAGLALDLLKEGGVELSRCKPTRNAPTGVALIAVGADGENQIVVAPGANAYLTPEDFPDQINDALIGQLEIPIPALTDALQRCDGLKIVNLAPASPLTDGFLGLADILIVNETEAAFYGLDRLNALGKTVVMTLGARGAVMIRSGEVIARAQPPNVKSVDTVGAGDTFVGALAVALLEELPEKKALAFACTAGALATTRIGAQPALPHRSEVDTLIANTV